MQIQTVAVLGVGAVGSYFIWGLKEKLGKNLWVVADGARREKLQKEGICINGERCFLHVVSPQEAQGADLLLVATKYGALQEVLPDIAAVVDAHTIVLSLLNGVDSEDMIGAQIGREHLLDAMMQIASQRSGDCITFDPDTTLGVVFGERDSDRPSERMLALEALFQGTPLHYRMSREIQKEIWLKFAFNVSMNLPQAIVGSGVGIYADSEHAMELRRGLRAEVAAVAAAQGIDIAQLSKLEQKRCPSAPAARYSTLQDLDAKRHTEIEMFAGTVIRLGRQYGIATPFNTFAYHTVKLLEEKNDGRFCYDSE